MGNTCCGDNNNLKNEELDSRNPPKKESKESKAGHASSDCYTNQNLSCYTRLLSKEKGSANQTRPLKLQTWYVWQ